MSVPLRVFVYRNLRNKCWSVKSMKTGLVIMHAQYLTLTDCTFKVSAAGRARVLRDRRKNVHAGVVGQWLNMGRTGNASGMLARKVTYNPYLRGEFYDASTNDAVYAAPVVLLTPDGVFYRKA